MDLGSILLILALLTLAGLYVAQPLLEKRRTNGRYSRQEQQELSSLMAERDRVLNAIQELDFDYEMGKIPEEDYPAQRAALLQKGAEVLRQLDGFQEYEPGVRPISPEQPVAAEDRLEATIAANRLAPVKEATTRSNGQGMEEAGDEIEVLLANRRRSRSEKSAGFCPQCGGAVQKSDRFCPKCGSQISG